MAFGTDGNTLYVANTGGESISIIDLTLGKIVDTVASPGPAERLHRHHHPPSHGVQPARTRSHHVRRHPLEDRRKSGSAPSPQSSRIRDRCQDHRAGTGTAAFRTMASTPEGQYVIVFTGTGNAYIYDALPMTSLSASRSSPPKRVIWTPYRPDPAASTTSSMASC